MQNLPDYINYLLLLPSKFHVTNFIIGKAHISHFHGDILYRRPFSDKVKIKQFPGVDRTSNRRSKVYFLHKRLEGSAYQYSPPPPLPKEKVENASPFEIVGIDCTRAVTVIYNLRVMHKCSDNS